MKRIAIIGSGPGGLSAGMLLAYEGYQVDIFEKKPYTGGRNSELTVGAYKFDLGPTFFLMKDILENIFSMCSRDLYDYVEIDRIEPMYRLKFSEDKLFYPYSSNENQKMEEEILKVFPDEIHNYRKYMRNEEIKYSKIIPCLSVPYNSFLDYFKPRFLKSIPYLDAHKSLYSVLSEYYNAEELKLAFTFQAKYIGMSPWEAPGTFSIISYIEHKMGVFHIQGGLNKLSQAMSRVVEEEGGNIYLNKGVKNLIIENKKVKGIELYNGEKLYYDGVVINSDFAHGMKELIPEDKRKKYNNEVLEKKKYSCSTFMLYLGIDKIYNKIPHHSIIFANDYKKNVEEIIESKILSDDFSFYVQNPSVIDNTLAPKGHSSIYILVPVPNNKSNIPWSNIKNEFKDKILDALEKRGEYTNIREHIVDEKIISPEDWEKECDVFKGAVFNLGHQVNQMLSLRPHNKLEILENCYLVGGGTHPGSGLPTIYESGRITSELIKKYIK